MQQPQSTDPIRVFMIDDIPALVEGLEALLARTPEGDIQWVGSHTRNTADLPDLVAQQQPHVVVVDLALAPGESPVVAKRRPTTWGIPAIEALRNRLPALKIIAYSHYPEYSEEALAAGANAFLSKEATGDELRQMIRHVMGRRERPPVDRTDLGTLTGLELFCSTQEYIVHGDRPTDSYRLQGVPFAFLLYVALEALERLEHQPEPQAGPHWVERIPLPKTGVKGPVEYRMTQDDVWERITEKYNVSHAYREKPIDSLVIAGWATRINEPLRRFKTNGFQATVVQTPKFDRTGYYALRSSITHIEVHD
jgi:DNA-binding NarL/FixJ family response regulator